MSKRKAGLRTKKRDVVGRKVTSTSTPEPPEDVKGIVDEEESNTDVSDSEGLAQGEDDDQGTELDLMAGDIGISGPSAPAPILTPRWSSLDAALAGMETHFRLSHGLTIDKAFVEEFLVYARSFLAPTSEPPPS